MQQSHFDKHAIDISHPETMTSIY